jgi:hypothetical protein
MILYQAGSVLKAPGRSNLQFGVLDIILASQHEGGDLVLS